MQAAIEDLLRRARANGWTTRKDGPTIEFYKVLNGRAEHQIGLSWENPDEEDIDAVVNHIIAHT